MKTNRIINLIIVIIVTMVFLTPLMAYADDEIDELVSAAPTPFSPDGQATVVDLIYEGDSKVFYTFKTPAGNVFHLVIDHQRNTDNVYFLNAVTEEDLLALTGDHNKKENASESAIPSQPPVAVEPVSEEKNEKPDSIVKDNKVKKSQNNKGMVVFVVISVLTVGAMGYYLKIIRPRQQKNTDDEDETYEDDDEEMGLRR